MKFEMVYPSKKRADLARDRGVDLLFETCEVFKDEVVRRLKGKRGNVVEFNIDDQQLEQMGRLGIDISSQLCTTYISEVHRAWDKEMVEDADKIEGSVDPEYLLTLLIDYIADHPNQRKMVVGPYIGSTIQELDGWNPVLNNDEYLGRIYLLGKLVICLHDVEVWVDPNMSWDDNRIMFIKPENSEI